MARVSGGLKAGSLLAATAALCLAAAVLGQVPSAAANCDFLPGDSAQQRDTSESPPLLVGALGIKGEAKLFDQWNSTFATYLTATAGATLGGRRFELVYLDWDTAYAAAEHGCVDLIYVNPSLHSCLELQYEVTALATLVNFRKGFELDRFYGTIFTRSDRLDIRTLQDLRGKIVEAVSISGLGACQLQWEELNRNGLDFLNDPKQVRFAFDQQRIVQDVIAGDADVGMVRTELAEGMADQGLINITDIRIINLKDDPSFPFPYSTTLAAPEWPIASLRHTPSSVRHAVLHALLDLDKDHEAAVDGKYFGWRTAISYLSMNTMLEGLGNIENGACIQSADVYDAIVCPSRTIKMSREKAEQACKRQAAEDARYSCPEGYSCVCRPCYELPEEQIVITASVAQHVKTDVNRPHAGTVATLRSPYEQISAAHCTKLETCAAVSRLDYVQLTLQDTWYDYRDRLGLEHIHSIWYRWWSDGNGGEQAQWIQAPGPAGRQNFTFEIRAAALGSYILEVKTKMGNGEFFQLQNSPLVISVEEMHCPGEYVMPGPNGCVCMPEAGFTDETSECVAPRRSKGLLGLLGGVIGGVLLLLVVLAAVLLRRRKQTDTSWKIKREDIRFDKNAEILGFRRNGAAVIKADYRGTTVAVKELIQGQPGDEQSRGSESRVRSSLSLWSNKTAGSRVFPTEEIAAAEAGKRIPGMGRSSDEALRLSMPEIDMPQLSGRNSVDFTGQAHNRAIPAIQLQKFKDMMSLRHPNIATVMGIVEDERTPLLVMEYMHHRSLSQLLENETVALEPETTHSIARDIACGMLYLHSHEPPVLHTGLSCDNVLIDITFRAKLTDCGLQRQLRGSRAVGAARYLAPELIANGRPSMATDVYAMGILLYELLTRTEAYKGITSADIAKQVADAARDEPFRPIFPPGVSGMMKDLVTECWAPQPEDRPTFSVICDRIAACTDLDATTKMGKQDVLQSVFPKHIADALAKGRKIEPEHHDAVTIFFSDIVGFTDISRKLDAVDVMNMLDRLYLKFDHLAEELGMFKVETIGDAYMAVANLAAKQPDHALRVAQFSIAAVKAANTVLVKEDDPSLGHVNIRVGFHTGPVVASVVGKLNPRYCLFGDTVNTASRMESNSQANMIHCSERSAALLLKSAGGELALQCRGEIPIKGKGKLVTYWVLPPVQLTRRGTGVWDDTGSPTAPAED